LTAFCSSRVSLASAAVKLSAMRNSTWALMSLANQSRNGRLGAGCQGGVTTSIIELVRPVARGTRRLRACRPPGKSSASIAKGTGHVSVHGAPAAQRLPALPGPRQDQVAKVARPVGVKGALGGGKRGRPSHPERHRIMRSISAQAEEPHPSRGTQVVIRVDLRAGGGAIHPEPLEKLDTGRSPRDGRGGGARQSCNLFGI
jgi:hypothetical protein